MEFMIAMFTVALVNQYLKERYVLHRQRTPVVACEGFK